MVNPRPFAEFNADFPDDIVEDADGNIVIYPGQNVAEAIGEMLRKAGCVVTPPLHEAHRGWSFEAVAKDRTIWLLVSDLGGQHILQTEERGSFWRKLFGARDTIYADVMTGLNDALAKDARFKNVLWFPKDWDASGVKGVRNPMGDD